MVDEWMCMEQRFQPFMVTEHCNVVHRVFTEHIQYVVPSFTEWKPTQRDLIAAKWKVRVQFLICTASYAGIRYAKCNCNLKISDFLVSRYFTEHVFTSRWTPVFRGEHISGSASVECWWNDTDRGKLKYKGKTCFIVTLSATNPTWCGLGPNQGLLIDKKANDRHRHDDRLGGGEMCRRECAIKLRSVWMVQWSHRLTGGAVNAAGLSADGYDFCTRNRTAVSWRLWLLYMQQNCQLTVMTSVHATG